MPLEDQANSGNESESDVEVVGESKEESSSKIQEPEPVVIPESPSRQEQVVYFYGLAAPKRAAWRQSEGGPCEFTTRFVIPLSSAKDTDPISFIFADGTTTPIAACTTALYKQWLAEGHIDFGPQPQKVPEDIEPDGRVHSPVRAESPVTDLDEEPAKLDPETSVLKRPAAKAPKRAANVLWESDRFRAVKKPQVAKGIDRGMLCVLEHDKRQIMQVKYWHFATEGACEQVAIDIGTEIAGLEKWDKALVFNLRDEKIKAYHAHLPNDIKAGVKPWPPITRATLPVKVATPEIAPITPPRKPKQPTLDLESQMASWSEIPAHDELDIRF